MPYARAHSRELVRRLKERRRFIQVLAGPRQSGKTTLVRQVLAEWGARAVLASADEPALKGPAWIAEQWESARSRTGEAGRTGAVLALDEIHKVPGWSESVKRLWDEDTASRLPLRIVLLASSPLLMQRGLTESLAGRFEILRLPHWSFTEMRDAFGFDLDDFLCFGGYPGAASLIADPQRWTRYVQDSLIETTISRDVLLLTRVDKPALLRRLFELACHYSGQIVSYTKLLGQLQDAGNTTTLARYLDLLAGAGMVTGLQKFSGSALRRRGSSPKLQVLNTALITAQTGRSPQEIGADPDARGRLVESAVGAHLANAAASGECELYYWREGDSEVDFVVRADRTLTAIEVKSGRARDTRTGLGAFYEQHRAARLLVVSTGADGIALKEFLSKPASHWIGG